jgi:hypothetical protein
MLIIFGLVRRFTVLGIKLDDCANCGNVCQHVVGRKTAWGHLFWIPLLFLGFSHGMVCSICKTWTPLPWQTVRKAMKSGVLHLDRPRPHAPVYLAAAAGEGNPPANSTATFDRLIVNPKRGVWDLYLKAWPVAVALLLVGGATSPHTQASGGTTSPSLSQPYSSDAHQCWQATDGSINGCRLADGAIQGDAIGTPITCYFTEPLPETTTTLSCDN